MGIRIDRSRTAITRKRLSKPIQIALEYNIINSTTDIFDYGCGKGSDVEQLRNLSINATGWDPVFFPNNKQIPSEIVNLSYVVNVIENYDERCQTLKKAWSLAKKALIIAARLKFEVKDSHFDSFSDGCLSKINTFQKFYDQEELNTWINNVLNVNAVVAAPGIFIIFRDENDTQNFLLQRYQRKFVIPKIRNKDIILENNKHLLKEIMDFYTSHGRLPIDEEISSSKEIIQVFGSIKTCFRIIKSETGNESWELINQQRKNDVLVFLALERFRGRPKLFELPRTIQLDVRGLFGNYTKACNLADELLFSLGKPEILNQICQSASYGKLTPTALYVHKDFIHVLSPALRIYEGCARTYVGETGEANIVKLSKKKPKVSYLSYPDFEKDPHPSLRNALIVLLRKQKIKYFNYTDSSNPFILHRKEDFIPINHPLWTKFRRLTNQEESWGLYEQTNIIGTQDGWLSQLEMKHVKLKGHRIVVSH